MKPLILSKRDADKIGLISSAERLAFHIIRQRESVLKVHADRLQSRAELEVDKEKKIVLRATAVALLGQAKGMRMAMSMIRKAKLEDFKVTKAFRGN